MRTLTAIVTVVAAAGLGAVIVLGGPILTGSGTPQLKTASAEISCDQVGSNLNAYLDTKSHSPSIARANAEFDRGVAECMWGRSAAANEHYRQAYKLLSS